MAKTEPFDKHPDEYEEWFTENHYAYQSELAAIREALPDKGRGIEIGIGSGRFAVPLGIREGVEPSKTMREKACERGLSVIDGVAEDLPLPDKSFDFVLMVTTICFVDDINRSFAESNRILKKDGFIILGFVDRESPVGQLYLSFKEKNVFYKDAVFYSTREVYKYLLDNNFRIVSTCQTIFGMPGEITEVQKAENGYGTGSFVVIKAKKISD